MCICVFSWGFPSGSAIKNPSTCSVGATGDTGSIPGLGRSPGGGHGKLLQYSCLGDLMDRGAWWATVHRVAESDTTEQLSMHRTNSTIRHDLITLYSLVPQRPRYHAELRTDFLLHQLFRQPPSITQIIFSHYLPYRVFRAEQKR